MKLQQLSQLEELFEVSKALNDSQTVEALIHTAINKVRERVSSQTASVFLFTKDGYLKRFCISGVDTNGLPIENNWFSDEKYTPGNSFTGKAVVSDAGSKYGQPQWSDTLQKDVLDAQSKGNYLKKLGSLHCAVAIPLNGQHRTFGVLEVINKIDRDKKPIPGAFSEDDVYWLSIIGTNLATNISRLRSSNEFQLIAQMSRMLVEPFSVAAKEDFDPQPFYQHTVNQLVSPKTCYKVCFLRTVSADDTLEVTAKAADDISWGKENAEALHIHDHIGKGEGFAGRVYATGQQIIIKNLDERANEFQNVKWIQRNHLKSYACFPLSVKETVVGTLSVYTGFVHNFDKSDIKFLENISFLIAAFVESVRVIGELDETRQQLQNEWGKILDSARKVGFDRLVDDVLHGYKNELLKVLDALKEYKTSSPGMKDEIVRLQINIIDKRIQQIEKEFSIASRTRININDLVREVVKYFRLDLKRKNFILETHYNPDLPDILAKEEEIREVIRNMIDNGVKAVRKANRKQGVIVVTTDVITEKRIEYIQITVEDNGIGIGHEDKDVIYERGYSTYDGGTGMGLFIIAKVIDSYGGFVDHVSTVGKGTTFFVKIPVKRHRP
jgi:signal transduction histidine kinase